MIYDCHVHTHSFNIVPETCLARLDVAGIDKMILLSYQPAAFCKKARHPEASAARLSHVMKWAAASDRFIPFYWIDPTEEDAMDQAKKAIDAGVVGFKVICVYHYPGDERAMRVYEYIAAAGKPMLFHSGILYSPTPSSEYNRPSAFEPLFHISKLRFALAHVSWPWHDECLAVYGHWQNSKEAGEINSEMFIDTTPGTPEIYREEVFRKLYGIGYDIENNIIFGTDCNNEYDDAYALSILAMDKRALDAVGISAEKREKYYYKNLERFLFAK